MKIRLSFAVLAFIAAKCFAEEPCPTVMPQAVERLLLPVLEARYQAEQADNFVDPRFESAFRRLITAKGKAAREARVALMDYYVGEHNAEELTCAVAHDGPIVSQLLTLYSRCDIRPSRSPVRRDHGLSLRFTTLGFLSDEQFVKHCSDDD